ncbi:MAG: GGDEF domain-containing protein [Pseudomonadota bacterium]
MEAIAGWFDTSQFMPHGHCFLWQPTILWMIVGSNAIIALSYFSIPAALLWGMRRRAGKADLRWITAMFCAFILACGTAHLIDIYTIWTPNYWADALAKVATATASAATAIALWPLVARGNRFLDEQRTVRQSLADANAELTSTLDSVSRQQRELTLLAEMANELQTAQTVPQLFAVVARTVAELMPQTYGYVAVCQSDDTVPCAPIASWGANGDTEALLDPPQRPPPSPTALCNELTDADPPSCTLPKHVPIMANGKTVALIRIFDRTGDGTHDVSPATLRILQQRVSLTVQALQLKLDLQHRSTRDPLTGLFNRRHLDDVLQSDTYQETVGQHYSLIMLDVDYLKTINDTHGHAAGDRALTHLANVIEAHVRPDDIACRYGGEEFIIVLPNTQLVEAEAVARRIQSALREARRRSADPSYAPPTVSAGIASSELHGNSPETVMRAADQALYAAKRGGRDTLRHAAYEKSTANEPTEKSHD